MCRWHDPLTVTTAVDQQVDIVLTGTDPDGDALQFNITSNPTHGTLATGFIPNMVIPDEISLGRTHSPLLCLMDLKESSPATVSIEVTNRASHCL